MGDKWICSNCGAENSLKFCTKCGTPRPEEEQAPLQADDTWDCPCGTTGNTGNFCKHCGTPRSQAVVKAAAETIAEPVEEAVEEVKEVIEEPAVEEGAVLGTAAAAAGAVIGEVVSETETPEMDIPEVEIPEAEVPEAELPEVELPEVEIPEAEVPEVEIPEMEVPEAEMPEVEIPEVEIPEAEVPEAEMPEVEIPEVEIPEMEVPEVELPEVEVPDVEIPEMGAPEVEIPEMAVPEVEIPEVKAMDDGFWDCTCGHTGNKGNFCRQCGLPKEQGMIPAAVASEETVPEEAPEEILPEAEVPEIKAEEDGSWTCSCGNTGNTGKFCRECGLPKEQGMVQAAGMIPGEMMPTINQVEEAKEPEPVLRMPAPESGPWDCPCGQTGNEGRFCKNCGAPREQGFAPAGTPVAAAQAAFTQEAPAMKGPEVPETQEKKPKKISMKLLIILIAAAVVLAAAIVCAVIFLGQKKYTVNQKPQNEVLTVQDDYSLFVDKDRDISFLYPDDLLADRGDDGDYIYGGEKGSDPYILIDRVNETTKPKDYFKKYQENLKEQYGNMDFSDIQEVEVEGKTVYLLQTALPYGGPNLDHYLELYEDCYITYTAEGYDSSTENRELYYAIGSLRTSADAYPVPTAQFYENEMGNFSVEILPDYTVQEFSGGFYAEKGNAGLFAAYLNTDHLGAVIYDTDDLLSRVGKVDMYLEDIIGVQSLEIQDSSTYETINGKEYIVYPVKYVLQNGSEAEGKVCLGDTDHSFGCYLMCYYLEKNSGTLQQEEAEDFLQSMTVYGDPNIREYALKDLSSMEYGTVLIRADQLGEVEMNQEADTVVFNNPEKTQKVTMEYLAGEKLYEDIASKKAQEYADKYGSAHVEEIDPPESGRYYLAACEITYTADKDVKRVCRIYCINSTTDHKYCIEYDVEVGKEDWAIDVADQILWSWKVN